jgi:hypothetical protein
LRGSRNSKQIIGTGKEHLFSLGTGNTSIYWELDEHYFSVNWEYEFIFTGDWE